MIELNGIQISDNNINTKKNVKIYVDEKQLNNKVGELSDLKTTDKSSIVNAINEVKDTTDTLQVDVNRVYSEFTIIPNTPTEQEFTYKQSDEGVIEKGVAMIDKIKGNSVVWNQLMNKIFSYNSGTSVNVTNKNGVVTIVVPEGGIIERTIIFCPKTNTIIGHKYLVMGGLSSQSYFTFGNASSYGEGEIYTENIVGRYGYIYLQVGTPAGTYKLRPLVHDLTQMFGAGNEPSTYEEFLSRKPKVADEYAYNEGTIVNNKVEKVVTTGRNLCPYLEQGTMSIYDGIEKPSTTRVRTPFIPISNKYSYCTMLNKWSIRNGCFYDRNKNFISSGYPSTSNGVLNSSDIPANAAFCRLIYSAQNGTDVVTPSYDVFMFAIGNTTIPTTKYEPYEEHTLNLSWIKEIKDAEGVKLFEDGMKSVGTAFDEVGKNKAVKRIGVVDLGTLPWNTSWWNNDGRLYVNLENKKVGTKNIVYPLGLTYGDDNLLKNNIGICGNRLNSYIYICDAKTNSSASEFISSLSGVYAYYELAEPIEVEYDEKNLTYPVVAGGTEEAITNEPSTAMRASITYGSNTVATILSLMNRVNELERKIIK